MNSDSQKEQRLPWTRQDTTWVLSLFGTAVGAGILFLPIAAGLSGFWPLLAVACLAAPMTYFSHRGLCRFVLSSTKAGSDITVVAEEHFGKKIGLFITILYFLSIYPIVLVYGVSITNTVDSFLVNQLQMASPSRLMLSGALIIGMMAIVYAGENIMLQITKWLVYPLIGVLFFISVYLIPQWNTSILTQELPSWQQMSLTLWITLPVIVFSFNHAPIISFFSLAQQRDYKELAEPKASQILLRTTVMLWFFVIFFVFSCVLSLTPADLALAKKENISILSYIANHNDSPFLSYFAPLVAFCAIASSFFGHYMGTIEGLTGLVGKYSEATGTPLSPKKVKTCAAVFMLVTLWAVAVFNPSVLQVIESFSGPVTGNPGGKHGGGNTAALEHLYGNPFKINGHLIAGRRKNWLEHGNLTCGCIFGYETLACTNAGRLSESPKK